MILGKKLKLILEIKKTTQSELASGCMVSVSTVNRWCNNKSVPDFYQVSMICGYLDINVAELYQGSESVLEELLVMYDEGLIK